MPQKYAKHCKVIHGFNPAPEKLRAVQQAIEERRQKQADKKRRRVFLAEPEELAVLDALDRMPESQRLDAAEGLLIARVARRKKLVK